MDGLEDFLLSDTTSPRSYAGEPPSGFHLNAFHGSNEIKRMLVKAAKGTELADPGLYVKATRYLDIDKSCSKRDVCLDRFGLPLDYIEYTRALPLETSRLIDAIRPGQALPDLRTLLLRRHLAYLTETQAQHRGQIAEWLSVVDRDTAVNPVTIETGWVEDTDPSIGVLKWAADILPVFRRAWEKRYDTKLQRPHVLWVPERGAKQYSVTRGNAAHVIRTIENLRRRGFSSREYAADVTGRV